MIGHSDDTELNAQPEEIAAALRAFRADVHAAAEKPEAFWENQRAIVSAQLGRSRPAPWRGPVLFWVPVLTVMLFCLFLFVEKGKAPTPDFAVGADQDLLTGVERAVDQEYPDALAPAALLAQEMEPAVKGTTP